MIACKYVEKKKIFILFVHSVSVNNTLNVTHFIKLKIIILIYVCFT